jgi:hypothetical protein
MTMTSLDGYSNMMFIYSGLRVDKGGSQVPYLRLSRVTGTLVLSCQKSPDPIVTLTW